MTGAVLESSWSPLSGRGQDAPLAWLPCHINNSWQLSAWLRYSLLHAVYQTHVFVPV